MVETEDRKTAEGKFAAASRDIAKQVTGKGGAANEARYGEAYQTLVKMGAAPQLKRKYTQAKKFR